MMKNNVLIMPDGVTGAKGYANALEYMGCNVIYHQFKTKLELRSLIVEEGVSLIFTSCNNGIRQLPIDLINEYNVKVVVQAKPFNSRGEDFSDTEQHIDPCEAEVIGFIRNLCLYTPGEIEMIENFMGSWAIPILSLPLAANLITATPINFNIRHLISIVGNFDKDIKTLKKWLQPVIHRFIPSKQLSVYGDNGWNKIGISPTKTKSSFATISAQSNVCINLHYSHERNGMWVNQRAFDIAACGGIQITDNKVVCNYLGDDGSFLAVTPSDLCQLIEKYWLPKKDTYSTRIKTASNIAINHTFFNRLEIIFRGFNMKEWVLYAQSASTRKANEHIWELEDMLEALKKGEIYERPKLA
jgi:hypothetical protein